MAFRNLPSLQALRCFEAAARLGSFALAAEELNITQSAISHQIRTLEIRSGQSLFHRVGNRITLTTSGHVLAAETRRALDYFSHAYGVVDPKAEGETSFTLAAQFAITEHCIIPELSSLRACFPNIALKIISLTDLTETPPDNADAALVYGSGEVAGMVVERVADEEVFPVCSPGFQAHYPELSLETIAEAPLILHSQATWNLWLEKAGLPILYSKNSVFFDDVALTVRAALEGHGIAMARAALVRRYLHTGELVRLFEHSVPGIFGYFLAWRSSAIRSNCLPFRQWVIDCLTETTAWQAKGDVRVNG
jgi:LysR family transcriptional regulator, glycine cleavage system transcriptional activator